MSGEITQLGASDFEETMDFLNLVFGEHEPHDFEKLLPSCYQPTEKAMRCHYAIRERGRIRSLVGMYPGEWKIGEAVLRITAIGAVSTHAKSRGAGHMGALMRHCVGLMAEQGYHLSRLGGQRQRYQYFGYERCGQAGTFSLYRDNLRHAFHDDPGVSLAPIAPGDTAHLARARELHDAQPVRFVREADNFSNYLWNWGSLPYAALDGGGRMVGYLVYSRRGGRVAELVAESEDLAARIVRALRGSVDDEEISIELPAWRTELLRSLGAWCESVSVRPSENWQIFDWAAVTGVLMGLRGKVGELADGAVRVGIEGYGTLDIEVSDGRGHCARSSARPDLSLDPLTASRVLFGPQSPSHVTRLPQRAFIMDQWCPLPLWCPHQDSA